MNNKRNYQINLSRGVVTKVAKALDCSAQTTWYRIFVQNDPEALEIAAKYETEIRLNKKRALQELINAKAIDYKPELNELKKCQNQSLQ